MLRVGCFESKTNRTQKSKITLQMNILFYEKPGCINNGKQKKLLEENGHVVTPVSVLTHPWKMETLRPFFGRMVVSDWFNTSAPAIKNGEIDPSGFDENSALQLMLDNPILIKRPLIDAEGEMACGFDNKLINKLLNNSDISNLQNCPNASKNVKCD